MPARRIPEPAEEGVGYEDSRRDPGSVINVGVERKRPRLADCSRERGRKLRLSAQRRLDPRNFAPERQHFGQHVGQRIMNELLPRARVTGIERKRAHGIGQIGWRFRTGIKMGPGRGERGSEGQALRFAKARDAAADCGKERDHAQQALLDRERVPQVIAMDRRIVAQRSGQL